MNRLLSLITCITLVSCVLSVFHAMADNPGELRVSKMADVRQHFADPPAPYRPAPLYVWNDDMQEEELARQLDEFKQQGYGGVFVHPRPGLVTPYLSDRWLELWRFTADEAQKRGMVTYIYDENSYPSGFAGGFVPELIPDSTQLSLQRQEFSADKLNDLIVDGDTLALYRVTDEQAGKYERVSLPAVAKGESKSAGDLNLQPAMYIAYRVRYGNRSPWYGGRTYVDVMRRDVTDCFLKVTLENYDKVLSDLYGKSVLACFSDEPQVAGCWSSILPAAFQKRWGYDLLDHLPSIHADVGDWRRVRHDYAATILDLFMNNFAKPYYEACEKRGIASTGHVWEHGWPDLSHNPDIMSFYAWQHWPGIDCLMNQYSEAFNAQFGNYRSNKEVNSIANQFGRVRKLCEAYGAGGWELTLEDMKRIGDFLHVGGINLFNPHLSYYTIRGARKRDHPQSFSYHAPYWEAYHISTDYFSRLSWTLAAGKERNPILVIQPTTTAWMYNWSRSQSPKLNELGTAFQSYITELGAAHVAFDLGSEPVMADHARVQDGKLVVGECAYNLVILPPGTENLESSTVRLLDDFVENGGKIISLVGVPPYVDCKPSDSIQTIKQKAGKRWIEENFTPDQLKQMENAGVLVTSTPPKNGRVYHYLRELDDGYLLFVSNTSLDESSVAETTVSCKFVEKWNPASGTFEFIETQSQTGDSKLWNVELPPAGSALFAIYRKGKPDPNLPPQSKFVAKDTPLKTIGELQIEMLEPNVLPLDYVDLIVSGKESKGLYFYDAQRQIYQAHGFDRNPWDSAVQFKDEILQKDHFPPDSGFELRYPFTIANYDSMPALRLVVERGERYQVRINGHLAQSEKGEWWLDRSFNVYNLKPEWLKDGRNEISTIGRPFTLHHEPETVYLLGDFQLASAEKGWKIVPPTALQLGSWSEQGRPCYPGKVAYTQKVVCEQGSAPHYVELQDWKGTVARVDVNGEFAGYIGWQPWRLDISDKIRNGENTITVVVFGSLKNLLGPHHNGSPRGSAWPGMFQRGPKDGQPAGDRYDVIGYGLNQPFQVF
ncbi:MAG: hypothetical protein C4527_22480 [Candidatus Omnitrophota bacterium]|jgi:hypothetical protein|nr:MAG: hypothetical protein C4527_22480 [Candidatus Omnitrophota bacterium]